MLLFVTLSLPIVCRLKWRLRHRCWCSEALCEQWKECIPSVLAHFTPGPLLDFWGPETSDHWGPQKCWLSSTNCKGVSESTDFRSEDHKKVIIGKIGGSLKRRPWDGCVKFIYEEAAVLYTMHTYCIHTFKLGTTTYVKRTFIVAFEKEQTKYNFFYFLPIHIRRVLLYYI